MRQSGQNPDSLPRCHATRLAVEFGCNLLRESVEILLTNMSCRFRHFPHVNLLIMLIYLPDELSLSTTLPTIQRHNRDYGYMKITTVIMTDL